MRQISARLPDETCAQLKALAAALHISQADVIARAISALERSLVESDARMAAQLGKREPT
jgi:predicted transcriptional regulator